MNLITFTASFALICSLVLTQINSYVSDAYMVRQCSQFQCSIWCQSPALVRLPLLSSVDASFYFSQDEIFHVPQTQRYCTGQWKEWDPKITTFPGLYLLGTVIGRLFDALMGSSMPSTLCSVAVLRSVNIVLAVACIPIFYILASALDPKRTNSQLLLMVSDACRVCYTT